MVFLMVVCSGGCAQTGICPEGQTLVDGECVPPPGDPELQTAELQLACTSSPDDGSPIDAAYFVTLTVEPGPIVADQPFGARLKGKLVFLTFQRNIAQTIVPGGYKRVAIMEAQATVHVRRGTSGSDDVTLGHVPLETTCTYDDNGNAGPDAGPDFPVCSQDNDNADGSNDDCTGLDGAPDPRNRCLQFATGETSDDCAPGGVCEELGATGPGSPCERNGFCVSGDAMIEFESTTGAYIAASSGNVLFGWDDQSTGAILREGGPNDGTWLLPPAAFNEPVGPNGLRFLLGGVIPFALECTMGVYYLDGDAVPSADPLTSPMPDYRLISFPIRER